MSPQQTHSFSKSCPLHWRNALAFVLAPLICSVGRVAWLDKLLMPKGFVHFLWHVNEIKPTIRLHIHCHAKPRIYSGYLPTNQLSSITRNFSVWIQAARSIRNDSGEGNRNAAEVKTKIISGILEARAKTWVNGKPIRIRWYTEWICFLLARYNHRTFSMFNRGTNNAIKVDHNDLRKKDFP